MRYLLLGGIPLLVRVMCWLELRGNPFFDNLFIDARVYHLTAEALASGRGFPPEPFWQPPGFPLFAGLLYAIAGAQPSVVLGAQVVLGSLSCLWVFRLADRVFGRAAAWTSWACLSFYGPAIFFDLQMLNVSLAMFLLLTALELVVGRAAIGWGRAMAAGLLLGCATITVGNMGIVGVALVGAVAVTVRRPRWLWIVALTGFLLPIGSVTARNVVVSGEWIPISYNGGINYWIGNNPNYEETVGIRPGRQWRDLTEEPRHFGAASFGAQSRYFFDKARAWMAEEPGAFWRLQLRKTHRFLRGDEVLRNQEIYPFRASSWILRTLVWIHGIAFPFALVLALAGMGILLQGTRRTAAVSPETAPGLGKGFLMLLVIVYSLSVIAFFVTARYRLPVVPLLCLFAGAAVQQGLSWWKGRSRADLPAREGLGNSLRVGGAVVAGVFLLIVGSWQAPAMPRSFNSDAHYDLGLAYQSNGLLEKARAEYERALELNAENFEALNNLAGLNLEEGKLEAAKELLARILVRFPNDATVHGNLGFIYLQQGRPIAAGDHYQRASEMRPDDPVVANGLEQADALAERLEAQRLGVAPDEFLDAWVRQFRSDPSNRYLLRRLSRLLPRYGRGGELAELERLASGSNP